MRKTTNVFRVLVKKPVTKQALGGPKMRLEDNINICVKILRAPSHLILRAARECSVKFLKIPHI
jgi:hypothetical protein